MNSEKLLICTDLDRTLIPNGPQPESSEARFMFQSLASHDEIKLAYVSGRHRALVEKAISNYRLPLPDFIVSDVGTTIYEYKDSKKWKKLKIWENQISQHWKGNTGSDLNKLLQHISELRLQEQSKQNKYKLSYYVPLQSSRRKITAEIEHQLRSAGISFSLIWSADEPNGIGLLDILPACASKYHAIEILMQLHGFNYKNTVFCGDSGNDLEVLASPVNSVLVANSPSDVRKQAREMSRIAGNEATLYEAKGNFMNMNGNYSAGILEGVAHYHPFVKQWMQLSKNSGDL